VTLSGIWTPNSDREVIGKCYACGLEFYEGEEKTAPLHMGKCARANLDKLKARDDRLPLFRPESNPDPEVEAHLLEVGKRMVREGRMVVKPNERAGFS
jgi:hypothetical protein